MAKDNDAHCASTTLTLAPSLALSLSIVGSICPLGRHVTCEAHHLSFSWSFCLTVQLSD